MKNKIIVKQKEPDFFYIIDLNVVNSLYDELSEKFSFVKSVAPSNPNRINQDICPDGYHPTKLGNKLVFEELRSLIM